MGIFGAFNIWYLWYIFVNVYVRVSLLKQIWRNYLSWQLELIRGLKQYITIPRKRVLHSFVAAKPEHLARLQRVILFFFFFFFLYLPCSHKVILTCVANRIKQMRRFWLEGRATVTHVDGLVPYWESGLLEVGYESLCQRQRRGGGLAGGV